jgi:hypothetical protein
MKCLAFLILFSAIAAPALSQDWFDPCSLGRRQFDETESECRTRIERERRASDEICEQWASGIRDLNEYGIKSCKNRGFRRPWWRGSGKR